MKLPFVKKVKARKEAAREKKAKEQFKRLYIATHPIDFSNITEFRNDAFPESGPSCWLDRPNALMEIERKERDRERKDLRLSRKALVCHYFAEGVVTYHDLSGNPSRLHRNGMYAPPVVDQP
jgi:hypothetical protein